MTRYGMAIDLKRCVGCQACATACKIANNLPKDIVYNVVYTKTDRDWDADFGTAVRHLPPLRARVPTGAMPALRESELPARVPHRRHAEARGRHRLGGQ